MILLIRDPRGVMNSREHEYWCQTKDCILSESLCRDMVSDYKAAVNLKKLYPKTFK